LIPKSVLNRVLEGKQKQRMSVELVVLDLEVTASKHRAEHSIPDVAIGAVTDSKQEGKMVLLIHTQYSTQ
ncbi:hypothetical protein STEG23_017777, partial [Scotinomys teguina]